MSLFHGVSMNESFCMLFCMWYNNSVLNQDLRGKIDYDTENVILKNVPVCLLLCGNGLLKS